MTGMLCRGVAEVLGRRLDLDLVKDLEASWQTKMLATQLRKIV